MLGCTSFPSLLIVSFKSLRVNRTAAWIIYKKLSCIYSQFTIKDNPFISKHQPSFYSLKKTEYFIVTGNTNCSSRYHQIVYYWPYAESSLLSRNSNSTSHLTRLHQSSKTFTILYKCAVIVASTSKKQT